MMRDGGTQEIDILNSHRLTHGVLPGDSNDWMGLFYIGHKSMFTGIDNVESMLS